MLTAVLLHLHITAFLWNDKELRATENLPQTSVETDSYVAVQLLEKNKALDFDSLQAMAEKVEGSFVFTVLDKDDAIWFVVGDNPLCIMFYDGYLLYASTQEILCKTIKKLKLTAPSDILEPKEGEILKINDRDILLPASLCRKPAMSIGGGVIPITATIMRTRLPTTMICSAWPKRSA